MRYILLFLKFPDQSWFKSVQNSQYLSGIALPSSTEDILLNMPVQRLKGGIPNVELPNSRLVTCCRELSISRLHVMTPGWPT